MMVKGFRREESQNWSKILMKRMTGSLADSPMYSEEDSDEENDSPMYSEEEDSGAETEMNG